MIIATISFKCFETHSNEAILFRKATANPTSTKNSMVSSPEPIATAIGLKIINLGGNAIDAAMAIGYTLAVTFPKAGNLGGGGFMLIYLAKENKITTIDYREKAPEKIDKNMFLDSKQQPISSMSKFHGLAVGVPGTVKGLEYAHKKYGKLTRRKIMQPAINIAKNGFFISNSLADQLNQAKDRLTRWSQTKKIFFKNNKKQYEQNELLIQSELGATLNKILNKGEEGFYKGEVAENIVKTLDEYGGVMTLKDLEAYQVIEREAISGTYKNYDIYSMPLPSSGGIHLIQMLNIIEASKKNLSLNSASTISLMTEVMKYAYRDRAYYLGDPDFKDMTKITEKITSKEYAKKIANEINENKTQPSNRLYKPQDIKQESTDTTHFTVIDKEGNIVSNTYTLNFSFGSGIMAENTGVLLNNEIDDFAIKKDQPNAYGLLGNENNAIEPNKRPLSSMTPFIILKGKKPFLAGGSPGGSQIITTCLQVILNVIEHKLNLAEAIVAPRFHHQLFPDHISVEKGINEDTLNILSNMGYKIKTQGAMGEVNAILIDENNQISGFSDTRGHGISLGN